MRPVVDPQCLDRTAASTSQMGRFETAWLTSESNFAALGDLSGIWIDWVHARKPQTIIVLDMDSSVSETHGAHEGSAYNAHFGCTCYHPLFLFNQFGDLERCALRPGNVRSADGWKEVLDPVLGRYRGRMKRRHFRGDAAFASPEVYELLEAEGYKYTIRLPAIRYCKRVSPDCSSAQWDGRRTRCAATARPNPGLSIAQPAILGHRCAATEGSTGRGRNKSLSKGLGKAYGQLRRNEIDGYLGSPG